MSATDRSIQPAPVSYIIATTVRTGSYLLCEALDYTNVAGRPSETLNLELRPSYSREWGLPSDASLAEYVRALRKQGTSPNGVFGIKIHGHHIDPLAKEWCFLGPAHEVLQELFPGARYIYLHRRDRRAQAISFYRATMTI